MKSIIEGALLPAGRPLKTAELGNLFEESARPEAVELEAALAELQGDCLERGVELCEVASGWRLQVRRELAPWIARLSEEKPARYSRALLETLAIIAYRQPITRADIEEVRGVAVNPNIVRTLQEREWVRVVGHRDVPGRPELLATTRQFLDYFGLKSLEKLPPLSEIRDFEQINPAVPLAIPDTGAGTEHAGAQAGALAPDARTLRDAAIAQGLDTWTEQKASEDAEPPGAGSGAGADPWQGEDAFADDGATDGTSGEEPAPETASAEPPAP